MSRSFRRIALVGIAFLVQGINAQCKDVELTLKQNDKILIGDEDFRPLISNQTSRAFYNYQASTGSYGGDNKDLLLRAYTSNILFHLNTGNCDLSLVIVHDVQHGGSANGGRSKMLFSGRNVKNIFLAWVKDDPKEVGVDDIYKFVAGVTSVEWNWPHCCTDGFAARLAKNFFGCITVNPIVWQGIDQWNFVTRKGDKTALDMKAPLEICAKLGMDLETQLPPLDCAATGVKECKPKWNIVCQAVRAFVCWVRQ